MVKILAQSAKRNVPTAQAISLTEAQIKLQASINAAEEKRVQQEARSKVLQESANKRYSFTPFSKSQIPHTVSTPKPVSIKAHPTGTLQNPSVTEINERESVLKDGANKTYSLPGSGTK